MDCLLPQSGRLHRLGLFWRLEDFDVPAAALGVMPGEPPILRPGWHIPSPLDNAKEGLLALTGPITQPDVLPCLIDLVPKAVIDGKTQASSIIYLIHLSQEVWPMAVPADISRLPILRQEEPGVDQLMQQRFQ